MNALYWPLTWALKYHDMSLNLCLISFKKLTILWPFVDKSFELKQRKVEMLRQHSGIIFLN